MFQTNPALPRNSPVFNELDDQSQNRPGPLRCNVLRAKVGGPSASLQNESG